MEHLTSEDRRWKIEDRKKQSSIFHLLSSLIHPQSLVVVLIVLYAFTLGWLSLERHAAHQTNALDLGYYSNTLWNTAHGKPFRFTTYHDANFVFAEFDPNVVRKPDNLLAFHVEPILLPLSLLYLIWPDPRMLLVLQTLVLASGAWPVYRIARGHLEQSWLALIFPAIYLMSPSLVGANLSDFHPVTLSASLFLWAFDLFERRSLKWYLLCIVLILSLKEEMGLTVAMLGLYVTYLSLRRFALPINRHGLHMALRHPRVQVSLSTLCLAVLWTLLAILIQRDAAGRQLSMFASRYAWLGHSLRELIVNALTTTAVLDWLKQPDVYGYLGFLLAQVGFMALLAPEVLLLALPEIAINTFSRFEWMRSGVAHYSAPIVPFLVIAAIFGAKRVSNWAVHPSPCATAHRAVGARSRAAQGAGEGWSFAIVSTVLISLALTSSAFQFYRAGHVPLTQAFAPFTVTTHAQKLSSIAAHIPPDAKVSAQSALYPHVPERADLYLFPTISDADYILLDVSGQTYPINPIEYANTVKQIINESPVGIIAAEDGYLLLARNEGSNTGLPDSFFSFARGDARNIAHAMSVRFGDQLELLGYDFELLAPRQVALPTATLRTYWRVLRVSDENIRFTFRFYAPEGYLVYTKSQSPTELWYPARKWKVGETIIVEQGAVQVMRGGKIGIHVTRGDEDTSSSERPDVDERDLIEAGVLKLTVVSSQ